jgi:hypothetical protein
MAYKRPVGDRVFNMMQNVSNEKNVDMNNYSEIPKDRESIHNALMVAGMTPGIGNIADITDATLYALEGEFGNAAWSAAAAIPIIGQMVSGKKALKAAKEAGEEMVTLYKGVNKWHRGDMVKKGNFVGGNPLRKEQFDLININIKQGHIKAKHLPYKENLRGLWTTSKIKEARRYTKFGGRGTSKPIILEFELPKSYLKKNSIHTGKSYPHNPEIGDVFLFTDGLPKEFLKKVHK